MQLDTEQSFICISIRPNGHKASFVESLPEPLARDAGPSRCNAWQLPPFLLAAQRS